MTAALASLFRTLNAQLLFTKGPVNRLLKGSYLASVCFFRWWMKRKRSAQSVTINNYDGNLKISLDISKSMGASLYWTGFHEFNEMRFLNRFLKDDITFVDVGANQGEYTLFVAKRLPRGNVLAFEPTSFFYDRLKYNVELNAMTNVRCFKLGLSDHTGEVPIYYNDDNPDNHEGLASLFSVAGNNETERISLATLDKVVRAEGISRIDFIKVDVEGSEWAVLRGAEQVLKKFKPGLMVELNEVTARKAGYDVNEMIIWLESLGYDAYEIVRDRLHPLKIRPFCNAVFFSR